MSNESRNNGLSFGSVLCLILITLKLTNYIDWSWWWVTAPIWVPTLVFLGIAAICGLLWGILEIKKRIMYR